MKVRAVFLDRDGTINVEKNYLHKIEDLEWIDGAIRAIRLLNENGFTVIVVTNQAGVARGFYRCEDVEILHDQMQEMLEKEKAHIDAFFYCPYHPEGVVTEFQKDADCRKPKTGMLREAQKLFDIDITASCIIGDNKSDIEFGETAGMKSYLVRTGHGSAIGDNWLEIHKPMVFDNVLEVVRFIVANKG